MSDPFVGTLQMEESRILPSGLHRLKFRQIGQVPDVEDIKAQHLLTDVPNLFVFTWMDEGIGHALVAWKEKQLIRKIEE